MSGWYGQDENMAHIQIPPSPVQAKKLAGSILLQLLNQWASVGIDQGRWRYDRVFTCCHIVVNINNRSQSAFLKNGCSAFIRVLAGDGQAGSHKSEHTSTKLQICERSIDKLELKE